MPDPITSLIEKLEGAEVGSRELDAAVNDATNPHFGGPYAHTPSMMKAFGYPANVTTSLDAALALAERVLPGWAWNVDRWGKMSRVTLNECDAAGWHKSTHRRIEVAAEQTPALALCAAILRAQSEAR